jgi:hypothetical protein
VLVAEADADLLAVVDRALPPLALEREDRDVPVDDLELAPLLLDPDVDLELVLDPPDPDLDPPLLACGIVSPSKGLTDDSTLHIDGHP